MRRAPLRDLQLRFKTSLHWGEGERGALLSLTRKMQADREFALEVVHYMLFHFDEFVAPNGLAEKALAELKQILLAGGSAWEITRGPGGADGYFALAKRSAGPMREVLDALAPSERAHRLLVSAWNKLHGREPDVSAAYRDAVRAVETAGRPVISPDDSVATLGKMIVAVRDKPDKWTTTIGDVDTVGRLMESVHKGQLDRHGTDDTTVPLNVSTEESDAAVSTAIHVVRLFVGGHFRTA